MFQEQLRIEKKIPKQAPGFFWYRFLDFRFQTYLVKYKRIRKNIDPQPISSKLVSDIEHLMFDIWDLTSDL